MNHHTDHEPPDNMMSIADLCTLFGVSKSTISQWVRRGKLDEPQTVVGRPSGRGSAGRSFRFWDPSTIAKGIDAGRLPNPETDQ